MTLINPFDNYEGVTYQECIDNMVYAAIHLRQWIAAEHYMRQQLYKIGDRTIEGDWIDDECLSNAIDAFANELIELEQPVSAIYENLS